MGVDLTLLPFCNEQMSNDDYIIYFSHTALDMQRRHELWEPIKEIEEKFGVVVPSGFLSLLSREGETGPHYGKTMRTPYGNPLQYVLAKHLKIFEKQRGVQDNWQNRAIWAYLLQLPNNLRIALYWH